MENYPKVDDLPFKFIPTKVGIQLRKEQRECKTITSQLLAGYRSWGRSLSVESQNSFSGDNACCASGRLNPTVEHLSFFERKSHWIPDLPQQISGGSGMNNPLVEYVTLKFIPTKVGIQLRKEQRECKTGISQILALYRS